jgi:hypothetical protein
MTAFFGFEIESLPKLDSPFRHQRTTFDLGDSMLFDSPMLFDQAAQELLRHLCHKITITPYGGDAAPDSIAVECEDCHALLIEFVTEPSALEWPDPEQVRYEGHYDSARDLCYVEVFKPGKSPYPMQERQDIVNHSPTGIAWGYGGSGPAQCALAILVDYLGDEQRARSLYQDFKFKVIAVFVPNSEWVLTGRQIENVIARIPHRTGRS